MVAGPELSVVIAALNAEGTLEEQLEALTRQRVSFEWETLVCDNGSTDGTAHLVRRWLGRLPGLVLVDASARRGPGAARNVGVDHARAPLVLFCDADDVVADDWLLEMHRALQDESLVTGKSRRPQLNSKPGEADYFDFASYRMPFFPQLSAAGAGNMGIRKSVFEQVGGFDNSLLTGEDLDLCWRVQLAGYRLATQPTAVVHVRNRDGLRSSFSQGYAYGVGNKRLRHKYARVIAAFEDRQALAPEANSLPWRSRPARALDILRRGATKVTRLRRPSDLTSMVHRLGMRLGFHLGRIDTAAPQLPPPPPPAIPQSGR